MLSNIPKNFTNDIFIIKTYCEENEIFAHFEKI